MDSTLPVAELPNEAGSNDQRKGGGRRSASGLQPPPVEDVFNCPRCDSSNTKFCYYNNYSLTQPRHYCKACRRYWTRGGTLRNVPIGGGCRKNKKSKPSSHYSSSSPSSSASFTTTPSLMDTPFKLFHGLSSSYFNLGTSERFPSSRFKYSTGASTSGCGLLTNEFSNISISNSCQGVVGARRSSSAVDSSDLLVGPHVNTPNFCQYSNTSNTNMTYYTTCTLASNIEAAPSSSINSGQDLYWKLQQQRLGFNNLYGGETSAPTSYHFHQNQQPHRSVSFHTPVNTESDLGLVPGANFGSFVGDNGMIPTPSNDDDHHKQYWLNNTNRDGGGSSNWNSTTRSNNTEEKCTDVLKTLNEMHHLIGTLPFGSN